MTLWFGAPWPSENYRAPVCRDDAERIVTPVGATCFLCLEPIDVDDQGTAMGALDADLNASVAYNHRECMLRHVMGCWSSLKGGPHQHDRTDITYRQEARLIQQWLYTHRDFAG